MPSHTDVKKVFEALGPVTRNLNWLLTQCECDKLPMDRWNKAVRGGLHHDYPMWCPGLELTDYVETEGLYLYWGCLSAFDASVQLDPDHLTIEPWADGNKHFWQQHVEPQHPLARIEIVCFDSTLTLLLSRDEELCRRFREFFPEAKDLDEENRKA